MLIIVILVINFFLRIFLFFILNCLVGNEVIFFIIFFNLILDFLYILKKIGKVFFFCSLNYDIFLFILNK